MAVPASAARTTSAACPPLEVPPVAVQDIEQNPHRSAIECSAWWGVDVFDVSIVHFMFPGNALFRGELAQMLSQLLDAAGQGNLGSTADRGFVDLQDIWRDAINRLASLGVIAGVAADRFQPYGEIRRDQMATMIVQLHEKAFGLELPLGGSFSDIASTNPHEDNVRRLVAAGITDGKTATTYDPGGKVTRAQGASFVMRYVAMLVDLGLAELPGGFETIQQSGTGNATFDAEIPAALLGIVDVTLSEAPIPELAVHVIDPNGNRNGFAGWLFGFTGETPPSQYEASQFVRYRDSGGLGAGQAIEVRTSGTWTLTLRPLSTARRLASGTLSGEDDEVIGYRHASGQVDLAFAGGSISLVAYDVDGNSLGTIYSGNGDHNGRKTVPDGTRWMGLTSDGEWHLTATS